MYLQITTHCNMACEHCCFACSPEAGGEHMTRETFDQALEFAMDYGEMITIGGGEPTIHPLFWELLGKSLAHRFVDHVWMATNGKKRHIAMALAGMSGHGKFACALSLDDWHDPIHPEVVRTFESLGCEIRSVERIMPVGAAVTNNVATEEEGCACEAWIIQPDGQVKLCSCDDAPIIGNIWDGVEDPGCHCVIELREMQAEEENAA